MKTWMTKTVWIAGSFLGGMALLFVFLVLGVQYGDTYKGNDQPSFSAATSYVMLKAVHEIKNGVYHEATIHNPPGDTIPDSWDNTIISEFKKVL